MRPNSDQLMAHIVSKIPAGYIVRNSLATQRTNRWDLYHGQAKLAEALPLVDIADMIDRINDETTTH